MTTNTAAELQRVCNAKMPWTTKVGDLHRVGQDRSLVCGVNDTTGLRPQTRGCSSWIDFWTEHTQKDWPDQCCAICEDGRQCDDPAYVGAHVFVKGWNTRKWCLIVPTCAHHNGSDYDWEGPNTEWFKTVRGTEGVATTADRQRDRSPRSACHSSCVSIRTTTSCLMHSLCLQLLNMHLNCPGNGALNGTEEIRVPSPFYGITAESKGHRTGYMYSFFQLSKKS